MACPGSFCRQTREDDAAKVHEATEQVLHEGGGMLIFAAASLMLALLIGNFLHHFEVPTFCQCDCWGSISGSEVKKTEGKAWHANPEWSPLKPFFTFSHVFTLVPDSTWSPFSRFHPGTWTFWRWQRRRRDRRDPSRESRLSGECSFGVHGDYHYRLFAWRDPPHPWWLCYRLGDRRCWCWGGRTGNGWCSKSFSTTYHHLRGRLVNEPPGLCGPPAAWTIWTRAKAAENQQELSLIIQYVV